MPDCPVCLEIVHADIAAFQHHVNSHFNDGCPNASSSTRPSEVPLLSDNRKRKEACSEDEQGLEACMICGYPFDHVSQRQKQDHMNACLDSQDGIGVPDGSEWEEEPGMYKYEEDWSLKNGRSSNSGRNRGKDDETVEAGWDGPARPGGWSAWVSRKASSGDQWWDPIDGSVSEADVPPNWSPGAMEALKQYLTTSSKSYTLNARLSTDLPHIRHSLRFDAGWGCGYRNALMAISALIHSSPEYRKLFGRDTNGADPGVRRVQGWIEEAWEAGFDRDGCGQLKGKVLGTRKWIGTTELYAMFSFKGIPCQLVDFPKINPRAKPSDGKDGSRPPHELLIEWVKRYFGEEEVFPPSYPCASERSAYDLLMRKSSNGEDREVIRQTSKLPIIIQHSGHSRTIVGYEQTHRGTNILMFDPGFSLSRDIRFAGFKHLQRSRPPAATPPRKPSHSDSHESLKFSRPYTNGASEAILYPKDDNDEPGLMDDEEISKTGWVKKKVTLIKKKHSLGKEDKNDDGTKSLNTLLGSFRVTEDRLAKLKEFQLLVFTGGPVLSAEERGRRKTVSSVRVT